MMRWLCEKVLLSLLVVSLLTTDSAWAKKSSSSSGKKPSSSGNRGGTQSKPSSSQPGSYPRQNPYPAGGSYPGTGNAGGYPRQNPSYPAGGSYPGGGSYPNQNPAGGYPAAGGYPNQNPGRGNPNQYPAAGGYPNQNAGRGGTNQGGYPNQYPGGGYPAGGGYPNQNPGRGGVNPGGYPNQYPGGSYPAGGGYPNQNPGRGYPNQYPGGSYPGGYPQYPAGGGYPVRGGNTGQTWGGSHPGGYPGGGMGGYPNWNPNNKILSPRYGGGGYGHGGYGMGGSPFSRSVETMGYKPKSSGFAKKAMLAAGVGAVAGMAVGYGLGRFPRPHFSFRNPEEEYYYNNYMYRRYGTRSTDEKDFGRDYVYKPPPRAQSFDDFMARCMNSTDVLKKQDSVSPTPKSDTVKEEDDDTVSIEEIGYPALIEQLKARRCVERYMVYSESFLQERKAEPQSQPNRSRPLSCDVIQLFTSLLVLLSSMLLLQ